MHWYDAHIKSWLSDGLVGKPIIVFMSEITDCLYITLDKSICYINKI